MDTKIVVKVYNCPKFKVLGFQNVVWHETKTYLLFFSNITISCSVSHTIFFVQQQQMWNQKIGMSSSFNLTVKILLFLCSYTLLKYEPVKLHRISRFWAVRRRRSWSNFTTLQATCVIVLTNPNNYYVCIQIRKANLSEDDMDYAAFRIINHLRRTSKFLQLFVFFTFLVFCDITIAIYRNQKFAKPKKKKIAK